MKRFVAVTLSCCLLLGLCACGVVRLSANAQGIVTYHNEYTGVSFSERLTKQEVETVVGILNGKKQESAVFSGVPSCGFNPDTSITIDSVTFALALDKCGVLQNCSTMQYIYISDAERETIETIFTSRGGSFPCV